MDDPDSVMVHHEDCGCVIFTFVKGDATVRHLLDALVSVPRESLLVDSVGSWFGCGNSCEGQPQEDDAHDSFVMTLVAQPPPLDEQAVRQACHLPNTGSQPYHDRAVAYVQVAPS